MANEEHLEILKQGVDAWNQWRLENPKVRPYLRGVDLSEADLRRAELDEADLITTNLREANLSGAILFRANLSGVDLTEANLREANLSGADPIEADLGGANLSGARIGWTTFGSIDLSPVEGLDTVKHQGPSTIGIDTLQHSAGHIPEAFLKGCGLSDWEIEFTKLYQKHPSQEISDILYDVRNLRLGQPIQINPLFISYSHADSTFVDALEEHLDQRGIRFWRDIRDATAGRIEKQIDRAIRHNPTVLLVLSENSVKSDWVQDEVWLARELEVETGRDVLCPVTLDDAWKTCNWPRRLRRPIKEFYILPFYNWKDEGAFEETFTKLIDGLNIFYGALGEE